MRNPGDPKKAVAATRNSGIEMFCRVWLVRVTGAVQEPRPHDLLVEPLEHAAAHVEAAQVVVREDEALAVPLGRVADVEQLAVLAAR